MARSIQDFINVTAPGGAYPYGRIKDDTGSNDGTPVDEQVYGDVHVFFARLLALANIAANGLPENNNDGYQFMQALLTITDRYRGTSTTSIALGSVVIGSTVTIASNPNMDYYTGTPVRVSDASNPGTNYLFGTVFSYNAATGSLIVIVDLVAGSGTIADWVISLGSRNNMLVDGGVPLRTKIVPIVDWDMDADPTKTVAHGLTLSTIRNVNVLLRNDAGTALLPLSTDSAGAGAAAELEQISSTNVEMARRNGGVFDSTDFNSTGGYVRGWITITYESL